MRVHSSVLRLSAAHFFLDAYGAMLGPILPFLHHKLNLSLTQAGILGGVLVFSSSLLQPLYGYLADRLRHKIFAALGPGTAGLFICLLGAAPDFTTLMVLVFLSGVGIASFHPQGAAVTAEAAGDAHGYQMSVFISSGMIGYSFGPLYITSVIALGGLENSYWAALPGVLMSIYLLWRLPSPARSPRPRQRLQLASTLRKQFRPLALLYLLVVVRSLNQLVLVAFLPLYFTSRGYAEVQAGQLLSLFLLAGGTAAFAGGVLADRLGGKNVILISTLAYPAILLAFLLTTGAGSILLCVLGGAFLLATTPVNLVMGQRLVPEAAGTVSALMMGFAWGAGGLFVPVVGLVADAFTLHEALVWMTALSLPGFVLAFWLPAGYGARSAA